MFESAPTVFYEPNKLYAITVNADDEHQYWGKPDRGRRCKAFYFEKLMCALNPYAHYVCYLELSEPLNNGTELVKKSGPRYHIHGTFVLKSKKLTRGFLELGLYMLSLHVNYKIGPVNDVRVWAKYITKHQDIIREPPFTNNTDMVIDWNDEDFMLEDDAETILPRPSTIVFSEAPRGAGGKPGGSVQ